jgi:hypothetical protein
MPYTNAPSVTGGPMSRRRSHRFPADKDPSLLARAVNASLVLDGDRKALFRITNDRVGHFLPSGGNWLSLQLNVRDDSGRLLNKSVVAYGRDEALLLDFWPFNRDHRIAPGERKDVVVSLPEGHGTVEAVVRYHDWMKVKSTVATLEERF